jgi:cytochrome c oxidase subunit 2
VRKNPLAQMVVIAVISTAVLLAIALSLHWFPPKASTQADQVDLVYKVLLIASVPIFVLVESVVIYCVWQFRMKPGQELEDGPPIHGNTRLEVVWTAIPAVLLVSLCTFAYVELHKIEKVYKNEMVIDVNAQQFAWSYSYPAKITGGKPLQSDILYLPNKAHVKFRLHTRDVIHDFWVPDFRMKLDIVPGITTSYRVTPDRLGTYPVVCAELCGLGHSAMRSTVKVVTPGQFSTWLKSQAGGGAQTSAGGGGAAPAPAGGGADPAALGKQIFTGAGGCGACHTLADAGTSGTTGPSLDKFLKGKTPAFIKTSIVSPNAFVEKGYPASVMPQTFAQQLTPAQINGLVAYLAKVTK